MPTCLLRALNPDLLPHFAQQRMTLPLSYADRFYFYYYRPYFYYRGNVLFNIRYGQHKAHFYTWNTPQSAIDIVSATNSELLLLEISLDFVALIVLDYSIC